MIRMASLAFMRQSMSLWEGDGVEGREWECQRGRWHLDVWTVVQTHYIPNVDVGDERPERLSLELGLPGDEHKADWDSGRSSSRSWSCQNIGISSWNCYNYHDIGTGLSPPPLSRSNGHRPLPRLPTPQGTPLNTLPRRPRVRSSNPPFPS